jgi:hypothetical protein
MRQMLRSDHLKREACAAALALIAAYATAAADPARSPPPACVVSAGARSFDLAELGGGGGAGGAPVLRHVSREAESRLWTYSFAACGDVAPLPTACAGAAPGSAALQQTISECFGLGAAATRTVAATATGVALSFSGGDGGRSSVVTVECADVARPQVVRWGSGAAPGSYTALVRSRAGCALDCARDAATGAVCGGKARGACFAGNSTKGPAHCVCAQGYNGAACVGRERLPEGYAEGRAGSRGVRGVALQVGPTALFVTILICTLVSVRKSGLSTPRALVLGLLAALVLFYGLVGNPNFEREVISSVQQGAELPCSRSANASTSIATDAAHAADTAFRFMTSSQMKASGAGAATFKAPSWVWLSHAEAEAATAGPPTTAEAAATAAALGDRKNYKAQDGEDRFALDSFFSGVHGGLILESGALDGVLFSTSWLFEHALGWRAIHVEASASNYARLVSNRPGALNIHAALCKEPASLHLLAHDASLPNAVGGIWEFMAPGFRKIWWPDVTDVDSLPTVACLPLAPLLALFGIRHVDFWVLDVEGAELEVLRATDFTKVSFGVIVIETDGHEPSKDQEVVSLLEAHGYVNFGQLKRNTWLVSREIAGTQTANAVTGV